MTINEAVNEFFYAQDYTERVNSLTKLTIKQLNNLIKSSVLKISLSSFAKVKADFTTAIIDAFYESADKELWSCRTVNDIVKLAQDYNLSPLDFSIITERYRKLTLHHGTIADMAQEYLYLDSIKTDYKTSEIFKKIQSITDGIDFITQFGAELFKKYASEQGNLITDGKTLEMAKEYFTKYILPQNTHHDGKEYIRSSSRAAELLFEVKSPIGTFGILSNCSNEALEDLCFKLLDIDTNDYIDKQRRKLYEKILMKIFAEINFWSA